MAKRSIKDCTRGIKQLVKTGVLTDVQANELVTRIDRLAKARVATKNIKLDDALKEVEGEIVSALHFERKVNERNRLLTIRARRDAVAFAKRFDNWGEGLRALIEGTNKTVAGARLSVDYQAKSLYHKFFGSFAAELEQQGLLRTFRQGKLDREIFMEIAELNKAQGTPGISKSPEALKIAKAYNRIRRELTTRQNTAGAYIRDIDGYIMRQTHDTEQIQKIGRGPGGKLSKDLSFKRWYKMILPLLDHNKTFNGADPEPFLKNVHENLYSGNHSTPADEAEVAEFFAHGSLARSSSAHRVLHFKDADSFYRYNKDFGTKNFSDGVMTELLFRSRNVAMMEAFGPNPKTTFQDVVKTLSVEAKKLDNAASHIKSLNSWRTRAAFSEVSGMNEYPSNITLDKVSASIRILTQLSKMGGVVISSLGDKAFLQTEMLYQGMSGLDVFVRQFTDMVKVRSIDQKATLHRMGIGLDALIGNTMSRYSIHSPGPQRLHKLQQRFYDLNFMNWWNTVHQSTAGELMAHHLGTNHGKAFDALDADLQRTLKLYDIGHNEWAALRHATEVAPNGERYMTPDSLKNVPNRLLDRLALDRGWKPSSTSRYRIRNDLETKLRVYYVDRIDYAVPTPGAGERKFLTLGTQAGTPLGETLRMMMMFKSFPTTVYRKILGREVYGRGASSLLDWVVNDHRGKFMMAQLIAMTTIGGYMSGVIRDTLKGRTPKPLTNKDGGVNMSVVNEAFLRGGGAGILGDFLFTEYDRSYNSFLGTAAGPIFGQADIAASGAAKAVRGDSPSTEVNRLITNNTPFINLFYIRPIIDYFILWNVNEMISPGYAKRMENLVEKENQQRYFVRPTQAVK